MKFITITVTNAILFTNERSSIHSALSYGSERNTAWEVNVDIQTTMEIKSSLTSLKQYGGF